MCVCVLTLGGAPISQAAAPMGLWCVCGWGGLSRDVLSVQPVGRGCGFFGNLGGCPNSPPPPLGSGCLLVYGCCDGFTAGMY